MFKSLGYLLLGLIVGLLLWATFIEPRFLLDVQEHDAEVPNLPTAWDGQRVALLADLQVGMWFDNVGMVRKAVARADAAEPAIVLLAGDFVYKPDSATVREAVALVSPLVAPGRTVVAVLGNHDYSLNQEDETAQADIAAYLHDQLEGAGITVLENEVATVSRAPDAPLHIAGIGSVWADHSRPAEALDQVPDGDARILLMHNPVAFRSVPAQAGPLSLAAHTHGGQVRVPGTPGSSWMGIALPREVIADGWGAEGVGAAGNRLYVNRGLGFSVLPMRLFCRPELTLFRLRLAGASIPNRGPEGE